ncbi:MAG: DUF3088 family protein [Gemmatimonadales bacterium]
MSERDRLFLLHPGFVDPAQGAHSFYCVDCAAIEGVLTYYPELRSRISVEHLAFLRPRAPLVELLGAEHQSCPVMVIGIRPSPPVAGLESSTSTGRLFAHGVPAITSYLAAVYQIPVVHP